MMTCRKCKKSIPNGSRFCPFCGTKIDKSIDIEGYNSGNGSNLLFENENLLIDYEEIDVYKIKLAVEAHDSANAFDSVHTKAENNESFLPKEDNNCFGENNAKSKLNRISKKHKESKTQSKNEVSDAKNPKALENDTACTKTGNRKRYLTVIGISLILVFAFFIGINQYKLIKTTSSKNERNFIKELKKGSFEGALKYSSDIKDFTLDTNNYDEDKLKRFAVYCADVGNYDISIYLYQKMIYTFDNDDYYIDCLNWALEKYIKPDLKNCDFNSAYSKLLIVDDSLLDKNGNMKNLKNSLYMYANGSYKEQIGTMLEISSMFKNEKCEELWKKVVKACDEIEMQKISFVNSGNKIITGIYSSYIETMDLYLIRTTCLNNTAHYGVWFPAGYHGENKLLEENGRMAVYVGDKTALFIIPTDIYKEAISFSNRMVIRVADTNQLNSDVVIYSKTLKNGR